MKPRVVEKQVKVVIVAADGQKNLPADVCEPAPHFQKKFLNVIDETLFDLSLLRFMADG